MGRRIAAALMALVLAVGLCPAAALADGGGLAAGGVPEALAAQAAGGDLAVCKKAKKRVSLKKCKVKLAKKSYRYTGKKIKPKVTVKYKGKKLGKGRDYKVVYKNAEGKKVSAPKAAGIYKVIVKGKGSFKGKVTKKFKIVPAVSNEEAKAALRAKARAYAAKSYRVKYRFADLDGDGVSEMLLEREHDEGQWRTFLIYDYRGGSVRRAFNRREYGDWNNMKVYKASRSLVRFSAGHGGESYSYFKMKGGKFRIIAWCSRSWVNRGWSSWSYSDGSGASLASWEFYAAIDGLEKGKSRYIDGPAGAGWTVA